MIATARLTLRPLTEDDASFMLALLNDPEFIANIADRGVRSLDAAARYIAEGPVASHAAHGHATDAVVERASGRTIGTCGLLRRDFLDHPDLGYAYLPEGRGRGYALEAGRAVLDDARDRLAVRRVLAVVDPGNARSARVLETLGFGFERMFDYPDGKRVRMFAVDLR